MSPLICCLSTVRDNRSAQGTCCAIHLKKQVGGRASNSSKNIRARSPVPKIKNSVPVPRWQRRRDPEPGTDRHGIRQRQGREREELTAGTSQKRTVRARPKRTRRLGRGRGRGGSEGAGWARGVKKESPRVERVIRPQIRAFIQIVEALVRRAPAGPYH